ncbi:MAG: HAMP domain-containing protein [Clostridia bacterium]|nr:HAMP domain-containing protein [Clostridia bacterium]
MLKSLYFKIVLILLIFILAVMCAVGAILMNGVTSFYVEDFYGQMTECFDERGLLMLELKQASDSENPPAAMKQVLASYGSVLGIDAYRNYYVLNLDGEMLAGSDVALGSSLIVTPNMLSAISGNGENTGSVSMEYSDWAVRFPITVAGEASEDCIIYIKDSLEEMRQLNTMLLTIVMQAMLIGVLIAVLLSFFLAKSISAPLQTMTYGTQLVASGEFSHEIEVRSADEIGVLAENFNYMRERLRDTIEGVDGEREKLDIMLSCMRDAVLAFTSDGRVLHQNASAADLFGDEFGLETKEKLNLETCLELLDIPLEIDGAKYRLSTNDAAAETTGDGYMFHDRIFHGRVYDVSFAGIRYNDGQKQAKGCVIIIHDVTARYELDESRREFVANVSHELRTPLTSIRFATETVRTDDEMDRETQEYFLDMVLTESDRMTRIVSDLLILSRLDNKRTQWNIEEFDFRQSVRRLCEVMRSDLEAHGHKITFGSDRELPMITADRQRIEQVVINIMSNAIKYTPEGGHIDIRLTRSRSGDRVLLRVTDNGVGIPEEDMAHLFERFYRVEKSRTQDAGGTGLGLAIAKEITEAHGGRISVESEPGVGTSVALELPVKCRLETGKKE